MVAGRKPKNFLALAPFYMLNDINLTFQIGSYFGAELCSLDIDSDGNTDFLLVGAPLFFQEKEKREGHIYVYKLTDKVGSYSKRGYSEILNVFIDFLNQINLCSYIYRCY